MWDTTIGLPLELEEEEDLIMSQDADYKVVRQVNNEQLKKQYLGVEAGWKNWR